MTVMAPRAWMFAPEVETMNRGALAERQRERLSRTLRHVHANVPHYRRAFEAHGVHPDDLRDLADLRRG